MKKILFFLFATLQYQQALMAQLPISLQKIKVPGTTQYRDVYVTRSGNDYLMNGDIIVDQHIKNVALQGNTEGHYTWPKGYIPVEIEDSIFMFGFSNSLYAAIDFLNANTRARFKPRTTEKDYIYVDYKSVDELGFNGGSSWVGRHGGRQSLNLSTTDYTTILHELMHALGFWHEQSRPDRDSYVQILWDNVSSEDHRHNFQLEFGTPNGPYDYRSIMHYFSTAFAKKDKVTLRCKSGDKISDCTMGNSTLSTGDINAINAAYWYNASIPVVQFSKDYEIIRQAKLLKENIGGYQIEKHLPFGIADGMYKIKINQTGKYLAIDGASKDNGARLVQWDYVDQANHKFYVRNIDNGYVEISAVHSNRFLNAAGQSKADGTPIIQWDYVRQDNVKWRIFYSNQTSYPGWVLENKGASPIQLQDGIMNNQNGLGFILKQPQRYDAHDYDPYQTFTFEKIGELKMSEKGLYKNSPDMLQKRSW